MAEPDWPEINLPKLAGLTEAFERSEAALASNDIGRLNELFRNAPLTARHGVAENLYGHEQISAFRAAQSPVRLWRTLHNTLIIAYGRDFTIASTECYLDAASRSGRQMPNKSAGDKRQAAASEPAPLTRSR